MSSFHLGEIFGGGTPMAGVSILAHKWGELSWEMLANGGHGVENKQKIPISRAFP
jgi:hypothetical protein